MKGLYLCVWKGLARASSGLWHANFNSRPGFCSLHYGFLHVRWDISIYGLVGNVDIEL
jgi:hypothetical protein